VEALQAEAKGVAVLPEITERMLLAGVSFISEAASTLFNLYEHVCFWSVLEPQLAESICPALLEADKTCRVMAARLQPSSPEVGDHAFDVRVFAMDLLHREAKDGGQAAVKRQARQRVDGVARSDSFLPGGGRRHSLRARRYA